MNLSDLKKPLPSIHWRSQSLNREGNSAMALAYMDARHVMDRLDAVCGSENWQDSYTESAKGRVICTISILIGDQWVSKSDGAGDTAVEGEKGGISDAFKRAAVKWGIGRYLYDLGSPWAECETYKNKAGKDTFKKWTPAGLKKLAAIHPAAPQEEVVEVDTPRPDPIPTVDQTQRGIITDLAAAADVNILTILESYEAKNLDALTAKQAEAVIKRLNLTIDKKVQEKEAA
jgi:hypothetical protein